MYTTAYPQSLELVLSPSEGRELLAFLEQIQKDLCHQVDVTQLAQMELDLGDALALGVWLREYVRWQIDGDAALQLVQALDAQLDERQWTDASHQCLSMLAQRLCTTLMSQPAESPIENSSDLAVKNHPDDATLAESANPWVNC